MPDKLEVYIAIFAALVCAAVNIALNATLFEMATRMIGIIILFYILGYICKVYLSKKVFPEPEKNDTENSGDEDTVEPEE